MFSVPDVVIMDFYSFIIDEFYDKEVIFKNDVRKLHSKALENFKPDLKSSDRLLLSDFKVINQKLNP